MSGADRAPGHARANVAAWLEERAAADPGRPAIIEGRGRRRRAVSYGELAGRVARVGATLREKGITPGDRVLLLVPMSVDLYVALLGVLHAGAVAVFVDAWAGRRRLEEAVAAAGPVGLVATPRAHLLRLLSPSLRRIPVRLWAARGPLRLGRSTPARSTTTTAPTATVPADDHALVTFTTGTTGRPKAAARSHRFLRAQHEVLARHLGLRNDDVDMPTLPVFVLNNLALGIPSVIPDFDPRRPADIDPAAILAQMRAEGVTTTSGSPAFYERLASHVEHGAGRIPVRALFTGGAPVFPPLARRLLAATEGEVRVLYGGTEAEPIAAIGARDLVEAAREPDALGVCAGEPVPEIEWKLIRPVDGPVSLGAGGWAALEVGPDEVGELLVTGEHVLQGYLEDAASEALSKVRDGDRVWHRTGDGARFDGHRLWLMGRVSQRVERAGTTWWSMAAEARALTVRGVVHAAYLGWPESAPAGEARAVLCVELADAAAAAPEAGSEGLEARLRDALAPIPVDRVVRLEIPRDPRHASKTDLGRLRERL